MLSSLVFANQDSHRSASLAPVALRPLHFCHREKSCIRRRDFPPFFSYLCAFFHFPYLATPLFATLTKTAGCMPTIPSLELFQVFDFSTMLSLFLSRSSALFCTRRKFNPFLFNQFRTHSQKHGGVGVPARFFFNCQLSTSTWENPMPNV